MALSLGPEASVNPGEETNRNEAGPANTNNWNYLDVRQLLL